jgi:hypothetical protein
VALSEEAAELLRRAESAVAAVDLEGGLPANGARLAAALSELLAEGEVGSASPRALWNLLWVAADLTVHVDVYRAMQLFSSVTRLFERHFARVLHDHDEAAETAEMAFDFFFNRPDPPGQPLATLRFADVLMLLERVLRLDNRHCRRAALHGLAHLKERAHEDDRVRVDAVLDGFAAACADASLADYARQARAGLLP